MRFSDGHEKERSLSFPPTFDSDYLSSGLLWFKSTDSDVTQRSHGLGYHHLKNGDWEMEISSKVATDVVGKAQLRWEV